MAAISQFNQANVDATVGDLSAIWSALCCCRRKNGKWKQISSEDKKDSRFSAEVGEIPQWAVILSRMTQRMSLVRITEKSVNSVSRKGEIKAIPGVVKNISF